MNFETLALGGRGRRALAQLAACAALALAGCSEGEGEYFSPQAAQDVAQRFHEALVKGDVPTLVSLARVPFRYKEATRVWPDAAALQANLAKEVPRIQHLLPCLDRIEVFSRRDLLDGKWPRQRDVPKDRREAEVDALGIEEHGWLARVCSESKPGYYLVLNSEGLDRLAVQMLDI
jgi:hypothetical protein